jgi:hypothetical protein
MTVGLSSGALWGGVSAVLADVAYGVSGQVSTADGMVVPGTSVSITDDSSGSVTASAVTNSAGEYQLRVPAGTYDLQFDPPADSGLQDAILKVRTISADSVFDLVLTPAGELAHFSGVAQYSDGTAASGLSLCLAGANGGQCAVTDGSGNFDIGVPEGTYQLTSNSGGALPRLRQLQTGAGAVDLSSGSVTQNLTFPAPGQLTVSVQAPDGSPVPGAGFSMNFAQVAGFAVAPGIEMGGIFRATGTTGSDGTLAFPDLATSAPFTYTLTPPAGLGYNTLTNATAPVLAGGNDNLAIQLTVLHPGPAETTTVLTTSPNPSLFGQPVTLTATVEPATGHAVPAGAVSFYVGTLAASSLLNTQVLNSSGTASFTTPALLAGGNIIYAVYTGSTAFIGSASTRITQTVSFTSSCITSTINGALIIQSGQSICLSSPAKINGSVELQPGGALYTNGVTINGGLNANDAAALEVCGSTVNGALSSSGMTGPIVLGDGGGDGLPACPGNTIHGGISLTGNRAGFEIAHNTVTGSVSLSANTGALPFAENATSEITANTITGSLSCSTSNNPAVTDGGQKNSVAGSKSGQCAGSSF